VRDNYTNMWVKACSVLRIPQKW